MKDPNVLDCLVADNSCVSHTEFYSKMCEARVLMWDILNISDSMIQQKSRCHWLKDGDHSSRFVSLFYEIRVLLQ